MQQNILRSYTQP